MIALLGLAFKADIDDLREFPALYISEQLASRLRPATLLIAEPHVNQLPRSLAQYSHVQLLPYSQGIEKADIVVLLVNHQEFNKVSATALADKAIIDTKGIW